MIGEFTGKTLAGRYIVEERLREYALGSVYRGEHLLMGKRVAIKILDPVLAIDSSIVRSFSIEAKTVSRLSHPNILNVTDIVKDKDGTIFMVMEDADGETLKDAVAKEGAFSVERSVHLAKQIAEALSSAHANLVVHGHLTTEDILLTKIANGPELVKIVNFAAFDSIRRESYRNEDSLRTLAYLSPEQCTGASEGDNRSDIYSLGIMLYEMLVGEVPFNSDSPAELRLKHAKVPPPPFSAFRDDIPAEIEPVLIRALAKNPDMRYQTASAFAKDLIEASRIEKEEALTVIPRIEPKAAGAANNMWKTAFILLAGIFTFSLVLGLPYFTGVSQTDPAAVQQIDENGQPVYPVYPVTPATGLSEKNLPVLTGHFDNSLYSDDPIIQPDVGGDGYDPWSRPGTPPGGVPTYQSKRSGGGGAIVTIPGNSGSIFTQDEPVGYDAKGNPIYLVRRPVQNPSPKPKTDSKTSPDKPETESKTGTTPMPTAKSTPASPKAAKKKPETKAEKPQDKESSDKKPAVKKQPEKQKPTEPAINTKKVKSGVERDT